MSQWFCDNGYECHKRESIGNLLTVTRVEVGDGRLIGSCVVYLRVCRCVCVVAYVYV